MTSQTFWGWLQQQAKRDDWVGDLARDAKRDMAAPRGSSDYVIWELHLHNRGACKEAVESLDKAFREYRCTLDATEGEADYRDGYSAGYWAAMMDYSAVVGDDVNDELYDFWHNSVQIWALDNLEKQIAPPKFGESD